MRILNKYVLQEIIPPFFFGIMIFLSIFTAAGSMNQLIELLFTRGLSASILIKMFFLSLPHYLHLILPMAMLLACLLGLSRLSSQYEILALKTSGVSLFSIFFPVLVFACFVSACSFVLQETIVPWTMVTFDTMYEKLSGQPGRSQGGPIFLKSFEEDRKTPQRFFYAEEFNFSSQILSGVRDFEYKKGSLEEYIEAKSALWGGRTWEFQNGKIYRYNESGQLRQVISFEKHVLRMPETPRDIMNQQKTPERMTLKELYEQINFLRKTQAENMPLNELPSFDPMRGYLVNVNVHFAIPLTAILFAVIGTAMGITTKPYGSFLGIGISAIIIFAYHTVSSYTMYMGKGGYLSPAVSVWLSYVIFALIGTVLLAKKAG